MVKILVMVVGMTIHGDGCSSDSFNNEAEGFVFGNGVSDGFDDRCDCERTHPRPAQ